MADQALALRAERWNDIIILSKSVANTDGDMGDYFTLPGGLGDIAVMEVLIEYANIDVYSTLVDLAAVGFIQNAARDTTVDFLGNAKWYRKAVAANTVGATAYLSPDPLVLWRQNEVLLLQWPELDTDATPTGDVAVIIKAVRVRPIETHAAQIQLVR